MIESVSVKHHDIVIVNITWTNGQPTINTQDSKYNVILNPGDILITRNDENVIEPVLGILVSTLIYGTNGDINNIVVNKEHYEVCAVNDDGVIKVYGYNGLDGSTFDHTVVKEMWTRTNHP